MGFAKYHEDIVSRHNNDIYAATPTPRAALAFPHLTAPGANRGSALVPPTAKETTPMSRLKEFTTQTARPLPVVLLADVSGSMGTDGKIQALNHAVREMIEAFQDESDLRAEIHVSVITFGGQARTHMALAPAKGATWTDLGASGGTPMGAAFELVRQLVEDRTAIPGRAYRPTIVLASDGQPTDPWPEPLKALLESEWVPQMQALLQIDTASLPMLWDADFLLGPKNANGEDTYVLCEINSSSVYPYPDEALEPLIQAAAARVKRNRESS